MKDFSNKELFDRTLEELLNDKWVFFQTTKALNYPFGVCFYYCKNNKITPLGYSQNSNIYTALKDATFEAYNKYSILKKEDKL